MALFNYASKEITLKVVYYGPGLCGKTTNLQKLHETMSGDKKGKLLSLSTDADRTLFFDFMPVQLGKIKDFNIRFQLYTVPGQVRYNATRKLVLKGADAVVFVADSQKAMKDQNLESLQNMRENLIANNINPDEIPVILQYNKRDLKNIASVADMDGDLNPKKDEVVEASAYEGWGVHETFQLVTKRLLKFIAKKHNVQIAAPDEEEVPAAKPAPKPAAAPPPPPPPPQPAAAAAGATVKSTGSKIHISVEDKANAMLADEPALEIGGGAKKDALEDAMDWGNISAPAAPAASSTQSMMDQLTSGWDNPIEAEPAPSSQGSMLAELEPAGGAAVEEASEFELPASDEGPSLLERMLTEESSEEAPAAAQEFESSFEVPAPSGEGSAEYLRQLVDTMKEILEEMKASRALQEQMLQMLKSMDTSLKVLPALTGKKPAASSPPSGAPPRPAGR